MKFSILEHARGLNRPRKFTHFLENDQYFEIKILTIHPVYTPQKFLLPLFYNFYTLIFRFLFSPSFYMTKVDFWFRGFQARWHWMNSLKHLTFRFRHGIDKSSENVPKMKWPILKWATYTITCMGIFIMTSSNMISLEESSRHMQISGNWRQSDWSLKNYKLCLNLDQ